ncbi:MAG: hypothetical protein HRU70_08310 [Phycisphaeraceae bacterium]|nr:MAG: hypothetical protein HRU70_08310 [Phycisphaeraceae bacterium]
MNASNLVTPALLLAALAGTARAQCTSQLLTHFAPQSFDRYGAAVAGGGSVIVVGAPFDDIGNATDGGARFIYENGPAGYIYAQSSHSGTNSLGMGRSVATDGLLVAAGTGGGPTNGAFVQGGGTIARKVSGLWTNAPMPALGLNAGDEFGFSVAAGAGRVAFGAPRRDFNPGDDMGAVMVYRINAQGNTELVTQVIRPANSSQAGEHFGYSVAIAPSGVPNAGMLVVGAPDRDSDAINSTGGIYVFNSTGQGYSLQNLPTQWHEAFQFNGLAVATNGSWITSGAPSFGNARGRVFLYQRLPNGNWEPTGFISGPGGDGGNFGYNLAMNPDWLAATAPGHDQVFLFRLQEGSWGLHRTLSATFMSGSNQFGSSVGLTNDHVVIGDSNDSVTLFSGAGSARVVPLAWMSGADEAAAAEIISVPSSRTGCLRGATPTANGLPGLCGSSGNAADVFYRFRAPKSGIIIADTIGSDYDTVLTAHHALPTWQGSNLIVCGDDIPELSSVASRIAFPVVQNQTYWLRVAGYSGLVGGFTLNVRYECPADFNDDGFLDFFDLDAFIECFDGFACPPGKTADFNADGFVDFFDLDAYVNAFDAGC